MALGPKAMGEAILANLKTKTGKDLKAWLAELKSLRPTDKKDATARLKAAGLGTFQAMSVVEAYYGDTAYENPDHMIDTLFAPYPEQRALFNAIRDSVVDGKSLRLQPCKGYMPLYSARNVILASFKPTKAGLYLGLRGDGFSFETVPHKKSLGGSDAMRAGLYVADIQQGVQAIREAQVKAAKTT
jgi:hypothetical protein